MRKMKKMMAMLLALVMTMAMSLPVFAADEYRISVAEGDTHTYQVYQIFTGDLSDGILSNVKWGQNGTGTSGDAVDSDILSGLEAAKGSDTEQLALIKQYVDWDSAAFGKVTPETPLAVPAGYYLIKDEEAATGYDSNTLYIAVVAEDITIVRKADVPELTKEVKDVNDSTGVTSEWQDSADYDIGDKVPFKLTATLGEDYGNYASYRLVFHDTESTGLDFDSESVVVKVGDDVLESGYEVVTDGLEDGCTFEIVIADLKTTSAHAGSLITVEYQSILTQEAVIGNPGNPNTAYLEFSNNPNEGTGTGRTPDDTAVVFTYKTVINKKDNEGTALPGAAFKLEKKSADGTYATVKEFTADGSTTFEFTGLDDGMYRLSETTTPGGYNTIEPIEFTITAEHTSSGTILTGSGSGITLTADDTNGSLSADVVNQKGATLPETGGMGTTILYVIGGILVIGAGILLITKKRMNMTDDK